MYFNIRQTPYIICILYLCKSDKCFLEFGNIMAQNVEGQA